MSKINLTPPGCGNLRVNTPYPGSGKSFDTAPWLAESEAVDSTRVYSAPSHKNLLEMERLLLADGVAADDIAHRWSTVMTRESVDGTVLEGCERTAEIQPLLKLGLRPRKVCAVCPLRDRCGALAAALKDDERASKARVVLTSTAALPGVAERADEIVVDENIPLLRSLRVDSHALATIRGPAAIHGCLADERRVARAVANAWRDGSEYADRLVDTRTFADLDSGDHALIDRRLSGEAEEASTRVLEAISAGQRTDVVDTERDAIAGAGQSERRNVELIERALDLWAAGRVDIRGEVVRTKTIREWARDRDPHSVDVVDARNLPRDEESKRLIAGVRDVLALALAERCRPAQRLAVEADIESAQVFAMKSAKGGAVGLDATPWRTALGLLWGEGRVSFEGASQPDWDGLPVRRIWRDSGTRANKVSLCHSYWSISAGRFEDATEAKDAPGINWPFVENEVRLSLATCHGSVLLVSFKAVVDVLSGAIRDHVERTDGTPLVSGEAERLAALVRTRELVSTRGVALASFGNVRSRNDWAKVRQVVAVGSPYLDSQRSLEAIGRLVGKELSKEELEAGRQEYARAEMIQALERGRSVRRQDDEPLTLVAVCSEGARPDGWDVADEWVPGLGERNAYGLELLPWEERGARAAGWLQVAIRAHGEQAVKAAVAPALSDRQWRAWRNEPGSVGEAIVKVDGRLAEMLPRGPFARGWVAETVARDELPETQAAWRQLLTRAKGQAVGGVDKRELAKYRSRTGWKIPAELGKALESHFGMKAE